LTLFFSRFHRRSRCCERYRTADLGFGASALAARQESILWISIYVDRKVWRQVYVDKITSKLPIKTWNALVAWSNGIISTCYCGDWSLWVVRSNPARV
jgi:hypothetical protein